MSGPAPKIDSQRRRSNKPASYGEAEAEVVGAAAAPPRELGIDNAHKLITDLWAALQTSVEAKYYSAADWQRVRLELHYGSLLLQSSRTPGSEAWKTFQAGLSALLVSAADKRRVGIEMKPNKADADDEAADDALASVLQLVPSTGTDGEA